MKCPPKKIADELARYLRDMGYQTGNPGKFSTVVGSESRDMWTFWVYAPDTSYPDPRSVEVRFDPKDCDFVVKPDAGHAPAFTKEIQRVVDAVKPEVFTRARRQS